MKLNKISFFKLKVTFVLTIFMAISSVLSAQSQQYFYEFVVPGLVSVEDEHKLTQYFNEMDIYDLRVDRYSQKVLLFSAKSLPVSDFTEKLHDNSYFLYYFNKGIHGIDKIYGNTIKEWNSVNKSASNSKAFVVIGKEMFNENQKSTVKSLLSSNKDVQNFKFSKDNRKVIINTSSSVNIENLKQILYNYKMPNKLIELVEIYK